MPLNPPGRDTYAKLVREALAEDIGSGDVTTKATVGEQAKARGTLLAKSALVVAGLDVASEVFRQLDPEVVVEVRWGDGAHVQPLDAIAEVTGRASALLTGERTALNILQRLSGIATLTDKFVTAAAGRITVLDTRKTTPGWRDLEKYAVRCGGGTNHRERLDAGVLIKDNHKRLGGGIAAAVKAAQAAGHESGVEVEVESLEEVDEALQAGAPRILLDNFTTYDIRQAMERIGNKAVVELSGGITLDRIPELATTGAQFVSVGALTHSAPSADISFELEGV
ncbi:MAG TPA: carboxylating nicotinate-nucleotide diphosphorylase [Vicinamibacterales bacterium]|jgi:nicotinate-nucleotide pyrophosphorylase (carboxylating)|nr:carboxylating nicotinate-nucleotide diphosphorylase [Vicinamibacterales bacterium]